MINRARYYNYEHFGGGLMTSLDSENIGKNFLSDMKNFYHLSPYELQSRGGISTLASNHSKAIIYGYHWVENGRIMFVDEDDDLYEYILSSDTINLISSSYSQTPHVVSFGYGANNKLYIAAGATIRYYDGSTEDAVTGTDIPKADLLVNRFDQLYAVDSDEPNKIRGCDSLDPTDWTNGTAFYVDVAPGDGTEIKALADFFEELYIFKKGANNSSLWKLAGSTSSDRVLTPIAPGIGCENFRTIAVSPATVLFGYAGAFHDLREATSKTIKESSPASYNIQDIVNAYGSSSMWCNYIPYHGVFVAGDNDAQVYVSNAHINTRVWDRWEFSKNITSCWGSDTIYFGTDDGYILQYNPTSYQDDSTDPTLYITTKKDSFDSPFVRKNVRFAGGRFSKIGANEVVMTFYKNNNTTADFSKYFRDDSSILVSDSDMTVESAIALVGGLGAQQRTRTNFNCDYLTTKVSFNDLYGHINISSLDFIVRDLQNTTPSLAIA